MKVNFQIIMNIIRINKLPVFIKTKIPTISTNKAFIFYFMMMSTVIIIVTVMIHTMIVVVIIGSSPFAG